MVTRFYLCNHITFDWTVPQHVGSSMVLNLDALGIMQSFTKELAHLLSFTSSPISLVDCSMVVELV